MSVQFPNARQSQSPYAAPQANMDNEEDFEYYDDTPFYKPSGRIGRIRYMAYNVIWGLIMTPIMMVVVVLATFLGSSTPDVMMAVIGFSYICMMLVQFYMFFTLARRRLNDTNQTGWWSLLMIVPIANFLLGLYLLFARGTDGMNDYGAPAEPPTTLMYILALVLPLGFIALGIFAAIAIPAYQEYLMRAGAM
ncbi:MAG: DUF805 domain-containing protein [Moraxella sp.]|nr:DUF805 domain-containing protein [Moraxella sp.]